MTDQLRAEVRDHYARAALAVIDGPGCCNPIASGEPVFGPGLYTPEELGPLPADAVAASLGCGNPPAVADLHPGETVLDLGSGGGIDVLLAARRVAPGGTAYGLDMTDEMLTLARRNAAQAGVDNAVFVKGEIEAIPLPDASVDVVISNCVINLSTEKPRVFSEIARVLRPGGRLGVSDIVADDDLTPTERAERGSFAGCVAGALTFSEYAAGLTAAGLTAIRLTPTHAVGDGLYGAIVAAVRPQAGSPAEPGDADAAAAGLRAARALPPVGQVLLGAGANDGESSCGPGCCCG
jgi:SAM-dependent methyltransferase